MKVTKLLVMTALVGCDTSPEPPRPAPPPAMQITAADVLDQLDARKPLPLLPVMAHHQKQSMRQHLEAVQEVVAATASRDFAKVERAAKRIGYSESMGQMCEHMGAGAAGFTELALTFHRTADGIARAAQSKDQSAVLTALEQTLAMCTGCHATYKQKLVADPP